MNPTERHDSGTPAPPCDDTAPPCDDTAPSCDFTVVIPAFDEEDFLPRTLTRLGEAMAGLPWVGEVIVVDNDSTDSTPRIGEQFGARVVHEPFRQISRARNAGARAATSPYLVFLDADTLVTPSLLRRALQNLTNEACCGGGAIISFNTPLPPGARFAVTLWNRLSVRRRLAAGSFIYCTRAGFLAIGGFDERIYASEEIWFSRALRRWGAERGLDFRIIDDEAVTTSSRKLSWFSPWRLLLQLAVILLCPLALFSRSLCTVWYRRPGR